MNIEQFSAGIVPASGSSYGTIAAWANVTISGGTPTIAASSGITSITDNGVGIFVLNFNYTLPHANYAVSGVIKATGVSANGTVQINDAVAATTTSCPIRCWRFDNVAIDPTAFSVIVVLS